MFVFMICGLVMVGCTQLLPSRKQVAAGPVTATGTAGLIKPKTAEQKPTEVSEKNRVPVLDQQGMRENEPKNSKREPTSSLYSRLTGFLSPTQSGSIPRLIKPKINDGDSQKSNSDSLNGDQKNRSEDLERESSQKRENPLDVGTGSSQSRQNEQMASKRVAPSSELPETVNDVVTSSDKSMSDKPSSSSSSTSEPSGQKDSRSIISDDSQSPFRKHDHSKYVSVIRQKAIDKVNADREADFVRICKDSNTDEWTLTLYYRQRTTYRFVTYIWDEIDDKWEESYVSEKRPMTAWKRHISFSSAGKRCEVMKGSEDN